MFRAATIDSFRAAARLGLLLGCLAALAPSSPAVASSPATVITFKIVKESAAMATRTPEPHLLSASDAWHIRRGPSWSGENPREIFFTVESSNAKAELPRVAIDAPGVVPARVIVGKRDVPFQHEGDRVTFALVRDTRNAMLLNQVLSDPEGGLPIHVYHNWLPRQDGPYRDKPVPAVETKAVLNYLVAAREALKLMGGSGPKDRKPFDGDITLMGFEVACARGHNDHPPHVHIMLWVPGYVGGEIPHFYMDAAGRIVSNRFDVLGDAGNRFPDRAATIAEKRKRAGVYGPGKPCGLYDLEGRLALELTITPEGGLLLSRGPDASYLLIGDRTGADDAVLVQKDGKTLVRVHVEDDAEQGKLTATIEHVGHAARRWQQTQLYDPFTGLARPDTAPANDR